ncbi:hypothetical protein [Allopusillimonas ginsengisoli]|uniref:hypothetical protein n=1 Tax=Allopusillimonas ginsengisoli TaxID=453575 RepID=UPI001430B194|nr:hypothetical protein [Allopusillimonas ginsengisoli]
MEIVFPLVRVVDGDPLPTAEKGSVRIMEKGKERHFLVDEPLVLDALTALHYVGPNTIVMKAMRRFKHYLTTGVKVRPTFRIRNLARIFFAVS